MKNECCLYRYAVMMEDFLLRPISMALLDNTTNMRMIHVYIFECHSSSYSCSIINDGITVFCMLPAHERLADCHSAPLTKFK